MYVSTCKQIFKIACTFPLIHVHQIPPNQLTKLCWTTIPPSTKITPDAPRPLILHHTNTCTFSPSRACLHKSTDNDLLDSHPLLHKKIHSSQPDLFGWMHASTKSANNAKSTHNYNRYLTTRQSMRCRSIISSFVIAKPTCPYAGDMLPVQRKRRNHEHHTAFLTKDKALRNFDRKPLKRLHT